MKTITLKQPLAGLIALKFIDVFTSFRQANTVDGLAQRILIYSSPTPDTKAMTRLAEFRQTNLLPKFDDSVFQNGVLLAKAVVNYPHLISFDYGGYSPPLNEMYCSPIPNWEFHKTMHEITDMWYEGFHMWKLSQVTRLPSPIKIDYPVSYIWEYRGSL